MIRHMVFWKIEPSLDRKDVYEEMKKRLEGLVGIVPGLLSAEVGLNISRGDYDVALTSVLDSRDSLDGYQMHPAHLEVKKYVHSVICGRASIDYEF